MFCTLPPLSLNSRRSGIVVRVVDQWREMFEWGNLPTDTHTHTRLCCHLSAVYTSKRRFRTIMRSLSSSLSWFVLLPLPLVPGSQLGQTGLILKVCPHTYGPSVTWRLQHCNIANYWLNLWKMLSLKMEEACWGFVTMQLFFCIIIIIFGVSW